MDETGMGGPPCSLCGKRSDETIPITRPSVDSKPRSNVSVCRGCTKRVVVGDVLLGWCEAGEHGGRLLAFCVTHGSVFVE